MRHHIIGIDPDCDRSGIAEIIDNKVQVGSYNIIDTVLYKLTELKTLSKTKEIIIFIEGSWLVKHVYKRYSGENQYVKDNICTKIGRNHEIGIVIYEFAKHYGLNTITVPPIRGKKLNELQIITKLTKNNLIGVFTKTNQEERDAINIALEGIKTLQP